MIRKATLEDLESILRLEQTFGAEAFSKRSLRHFLIRGSTLVMEHELGNIMGYAILLTRRGSTKARLYSITIDPDHRGRGWSKQLLSATEEEARALGCIQMTLEVAVSNVIAKALYDRAGYSIVKLLPGYYRDGGDALKMAVTLDITKNT